MTPKALDNHLRKLTPSEENYRKGVPNTMFEGLPTVMCRGVRVKAMGFSQDRSPQFDSLSLYLKKQARFSACPLHIHNWIEINYMYSGCCPQVINGTSYTLQKGQVVLIDSDTPHSTGCLGEDDIMVSLLMERSYLNSNFFTRLSQDSMVSRFFINAINRNASHDNYILFHAEKSRKLPLFFQELMCEFLDPSINSCDILNSLITLILCELIEVYEKDLDRQDLTMNKNAISPILRYIEANYKTCTLESTAEFFNMNPNYMTTLLKQRTGHAYKELIHQQRMTRAGQLLRNTSYSVTEVANEVGYENISFFYKKFKEHFGCSPKEYR